MAVESSVANPEVTVKPPDMGLGRTARAMDILAESERVRPEDVQGTIDDPLHRAVVGAAYRRELTLPSVPLGQLVKREIGFLETICDWAGVDRPGLDEVTMLLGRVQEARRGILLPHDRVIPAGLDLPRIYKAIYDFNSDRKDKIKLYKERDEWWRKEGVRGESTESTVLHMDFDRPFTVDLNHKPFGLTYDQQVAWARDQGGDGITSVTETLYLYLRCAMEEARLLWSSHSMRCRDSYGSGCSLCVYSSGGYGLGISYCHLGDARWDIGALPRKCIVA